MARILIVDDEFANRLLVRTILEHAGHEIVEAADASEGLRFARESIPDLAIVDLSLPGASGVEFITMLRRDPKTRAMTIALYTGSDVDASMRDFMAVAGITHVIPKPCEPPALLRLVEAALTN